MNIAIDTSPLSTGNYLRHRVRGVGFYIENLKQSFLQYFPDNSYAFFTQSDMLSPITDVVHYPYFEPFFITLPFINRYKTVITVHDLTPFVFPKHFPAGIRGSIKWQIQKWLLQKSDAIITDSESSKKDIVKFTGINQKKIHVIYLAAGEVFKKIHNEQNMQKIKQKYQLPDKFALYVGDVTWNKNLPLLIKAIQKIKIPFVIVGKTIAEKTFDVSNPWNQDLAKVHTLLKNDEHIIRLGFIPTEDLVTIYNMATVFVMPSLYEGFGLPILEAMQSGCPVVTSRAGSIPEVAGDAAYYVNVNSAENIAEGIEKVFFSKKLQQDFSQKGLLQAKKFSWRTVATETMNVYKSVSR